MLLTLVITFVFDTGIGLAVGIGASVLFYLGDLAFASTTAPVAYYAAPGIEEVILQGDLTFIQCSRFQNFMDSLYRTEPGTQIIFSYILIKISLLLYFQDYFTPRFSYRINSQHIFTDTFTHFQIIFCT